MSCLLLAVFCDGAEMKRGFPNSVEARQNFITKYNVSVPLLIFFSLLTCQLGLSSVTYSSG